MRQRRHGDPEMVKKPGRKPSPDVLYWRTQLREFSPSTMARYVSAMRLLNTVDIETRKATLQRAIRPNGSINVSRLLDMATMAAIMHAEETDSRKAPVQEAKGLGRKGEGRIHSTAQN